MTQQFAGEIAIGRVRGQVVITLDTPEGVRVLSITLTPEAYGNALSGLADQECAVELHDQNLPHIGKEREEREAEVVVTVAGDDPTNAEIDAAVAPHEREGWQAVRRDFRVSRRLLREVGHQQTYFIRFERWV